MSNNTKISNQSARPGSRRSKRVDLILSAFHDCIISQGYAKTTLRDVAKTAHMSASHLLYYFPGKDVILQEYFEGIAQRILNRLALFSPESTEQQIELFADLFFTAKGISKSEVGFMLECFGVAVHDEDLKRDKTKLDQLCKAALRDLFEKSPCDPKRVSDNAEISYSLLIGLRTAAYFDHSLRLSHARDLFYNTVVKLAET